MPLDTLLRPTVDFVFKRIFGTEENRDVLVSFLNAVFEDTEQPLIQSVELLNPFIDKDALSDKLAVLDVKARTETGTLIDVEVQLRNGQAMEKRTLYDWSKLFQNPLEEGDSHRQLHKAITINVLDFDLIGENSSLKELAADNFSVNRMNDTSSPQDRVGISHADIRFLLFPVRLAETLAHRTPNVYSYAIEILSGIDRTVVSGKTVSMGPSPRQLRLRSYTAGSISASWQCSRRRQSRASQIAPTVDRRRRESDHLVI